MKVTERLMVGVVITLLVGASGWVAVASQDTGATTTSGSPSTTTTVTRSATSSSLAPSTTAVASQLSPAWVGAQQQFEDVEQFEPTETGLRRARAAADYTVSNPNEWITPMGAMCWADFELNRTFEMEFVRQELDSYLIPVLIQQLRIESQVPSGLGPATTEAVIALLESRASTTTTGATANQLPFIESGIVAMLRIQHDKAGTGMEWLDALDAVAGEKWAAAVRAGDGLPADVLVYADALAAKAREQIAAGRPRINVYMFGPDLDGYWAFVELAKYDQNCLRAMIGDPPPPLPDIPDLLTTTTEVGATTTTLRSGSVRVSGNGLNGVLRLGLSGVGVGYSRAGGEGSLTDTTFRHGGMGYEVERLLWWPNGTIRLDVYPDGLHTAVGDDAYLVITPGEDDNPIEHVWDTADARYLGGAADFVWDTTFTPQFGTVYRVEFRIGVPGVPENVRLSGTSVVWDAGEGPAATKYHVWIRPATPGPGPDSFFNTPTFGTEAHWDMRGMAWYVGDSLLFQVRAYNSAGYSPWTEPQTFTTPGSYRHHVDNPGYYVHDILAY